MADRVPVWDRPERGIIRPALRFVTAGSWALGAAAAELLDAARPKLNAAGLWPLTLWGRRSG